MAEAKASMLDSTSVIPSLPQEIIFEILSKLPVKSLLKFRSMEKNTTAIWVMLRWDSHLSGCSLSSLLFSPITELSEMISMRNVDIKWCDTVNGLICLAGWENIDNYRIFPETEIKLYILNPSIRRCKILPRVTPLPDHNTFFSYGFGYDESGDEYKIVVIYNEFKDIKVKIYSMKTDDTWRTIGDFQEGSFINSSSKCVKGKLYWTSLSENNGYGVSRIIVSFDVANETWDRVEQPVYGEGRHHSDVWVMNDSEVEASWKKMFSIRCPPCPRNFTFITHSSVLFSPFFGPSYKGEFLLLYRSVFMIYIPKDESIRRVEFTELTGWFEAEIFVESLVDPLSIGDQGRDDNEGLKSFR
ncbi:hypothetical protein P3S67_017909 [Capsicum chacoense]